MNGPGGQGVGGVLLGTRLGDFFRVVRYHPIPCEYSLGPDFRLSAREEAGLATLLARLKLGTEMDDLRPVGWFVSHPRGGLMMSGEERRLHGMLFGGGALTLVGKPDRLGEMDVAVHYAPEESIPCEYRLEPVLSIVPDVSFRPARKPVSARRMAPESPEAATPVERVFAAAEPSPGIMWKIAPVLVLVVLLSAVCGAFYWKWRGAGVASISRASVGNPIEMLSLHASESGGRFYISWNGKSDALQGASRVLLVIQDGGHLKRYELSAKAAAKGVRAYRRASSYVKVTLEVHTEKGGVVEETTHYGAPEFTAPAVVQSSMEETSPGVYDAAGILQIPAK